MKRETSADLIEKLADEFLMAKQQGEDPSLSDYCRRYPALEHEIQSIFPMMLMLEDAKQTGLPPDAARPERIGGYRIIGELGRGGMGVVYEAEQESLDRRVALKVFPQRLAADISAIHRFQRESRAAASMHHTNIVPVFEVGEADGYLFYAMQLIEGQSLDNVIRELRRFGATGSNSNPPNVPNFKPISPGADSSAAVDTSQLSYVSSNRQQYFRSIAKIGLQVADAMAYAHERGIIHRDIKPSNLLLDAGHVVWVTDFGLAKADEGDVTRTGDFLGTLRYMSPERFHGKCDVRGDIYALGLTLYELLTLRPAYSSTDRLKLITMIDKQELSMPRETNPSIPKDLETIVMTAADKDPAARYPSAKAMSDDLRNFIEDQPIKARRRSLTERLLRWSKRNPSRAALHVLVPLLMLSVGVIAGSIWLWQQSEFARQQADERRQIAESSQTLALQKSEQAERIATVNRIMLAFDEWKDSSIAVAKERLDACAQRYRNWEWYFVDQLCHSEQLKVEHRHIAYAVDFSPDGATLASIDTERLQITDIESGNVIATAPGPCKRNRCLDFSTDGQLIACGGMRGRIAIVDLKGNILQSLRGHETNVTSIAFSPDDRYVASSGSDRLVVIWDRLTGEPHLSLQHARPVTGLSYSPNGKQIATATRGGQVTLFATDTGDQLRQWTGHDEPITEVAWSPDGQQIATASDDETIQLWNATTGEKQKRFDSFGDDASKSICYRPDGKQIAAACGKVVKIWDLSAANQPQLIRAHSDEIRRIRYNRQGTRLATASDDRSVKIWNPHRSQGVLEVPSENGPTSVAFSPDGHRLARAENHSIVVSNATTRDTLGTSRELTIANTGRLAGLTFTKDGSKIAAVSHTKSRGAQVWDASNGELLLTLRNQSERIVALAGHPDSKRLITVGVAPDILAIWNLETGAQEFMKRLPGQPESVCISADGNQFTWGDFNGHIRTYDMLTKKLIWQTRPHAGRILRLKYSPTNDRLAVSSAKKVLLLNVSDGKLLLVIRRHIDWVQGLAFSPDGTRLATASRDRSVRLWDTETGDQVFAFVHIPGWGVDVSFSPNNQQLACAIYENESLGLLKVWYATRSNSD